MIDSLIETLRKTLGDELVSTSRADREDASADSSDMTPTLPDAVVWPEGTEDVLFVVEHCRRNRVPITPRGGGGGHTGGAIPIRGGIVVDCSRMTGRLEVDASLREVRVSAGVTIDALARACAEAGLLLPIAEGEAPLGATIGGALATDALGARSLAYGSTRALVRGLTAVTGVGEVVRTGHRCIKAGSAYDLTQALVGSEGTLAVICEATLRLPPQPASSATEAWSFVDVQAAAGAAVALAGVDALMSACELFDRSATQAHGLGPGALLALEFHGDHVDIVTRRREAAARIVREYEGRKTPVPTTLLAGRRALAAAIRDRHPGTLTIRADLGCPLSDLPALLSMARDLASRRGLALYAFGSAALGVLDVMIQEDPGDMHRWEEASDAKDHLVDFVVDRGGSCSAGSGIGLAHRGHMKREHGMAVEVMRRFALAFDPEGLMNPGKMLP